MAFSSNSSEGPMAEINIIPLADVMLVLLIIFMVAAPLATVDIPVDLPASSSEPQPRPDAPVYLSVQADRSLVLNDQPVTRDTLAAALDKTCAGDKEQRIFLRADKAVDYGEVMKVIDALRTSGYLKVALVGLEQAGAGRDTST